MATESDIELLKHLLKNDEGFHLDFKERIDIDSKPGKAEFLKDVMALANSPTKPSFLVLGVKDKTKELLGLQEKLTEETLQNIVRSYCTPPIAFSFKVIPHNNINIGVLTINSIRRPYRLKTEFRYPIGKKKQNAISEKDVFIRHGSTIDKADPEEIMEMERERHSIDTEGLENIALEISDIRSSISNLSWYFEKIEYYLGRDRSIEYSFIGIVSGISISLLGVTGWQYMLLTASALSIMIGIISSAIKLVRFGLLRSIAVGTIVGIGYTIFSILDNIILIYVLGNESTTIMLSLLGGMKGIIGGLVAELLIGRGEMAS